MDARTIVTEPLADVCGYRPVRILSIGSTATTLLVHTPGESLVARVLHHHAAVGLVEREVAMSDAAAEAGGSLARHVSLVCDLGTLADGRAVLLSSYVAGPRLDTLLAARGNDLSLGEAVTLLAPIASLMHDAHRVGLTGLDVTASAIRVSDSGAPVITRRRGARLGPVLPERFRDREAAYPDDLDALERFGVTVAAALGEGDRSRLLTAVRRRGESLEHALFDLADPIPLRVAMVSAPASDAGAATPRVGHRVASPAEVPASVPSSALPSQSPITVSLLTAVESLGLPERLVSPVRNVVHRTEAFVHRITATLVARLPRAADLVRPRFMVAGIAGGLALIVAIVTISFSGDPQAVSDTSPAETKPAGTAVTSRVNGLPETELRPDDESWHLIVRELVGRWANCVDPTRAGEAAGTPPPDSGARECETDTTHAGSPAEMLMTVADDRHDLLSSWYRAEGTIVIVERMGGAVLIDLVTASTTTASLLVVRSEPGWRVRDVIG